jgi:two-component system, sensor histidine kinase and response regulator
MSTDKQNKILVIEDAAPLRSDIIEMLQYEGFNVTGAENGLVGVNKAHEFHPDLIICDIMMPELDGYGVLKSLRDDPQTAAIPFIFLTAKTDRNDMRMGMVQGADDYLPKPFVAAELLEAIKARLDKSRQLHELVQTRIQEISNNIITALPHELRTPLNTIMGFSDMLIMEAQRLQPEQVTEWGQHINDAAQRLYRLVENYLLFVRAEVVLSNEIEREAVRQSTVQHPSTVIEFHAMHQAQVVGREDDLTISIKGDDPAIHATDHDLGKVVSELVDNGLKFAKEGNVEVVAHQEEGHYVVTVRDSGIGMTSEQVNALGAAHVQFNRWLHEQQGSGMGIAMSKRLLELYGATLHLESQPDQGTTAQCRFVIA